MAVKIAKYHQWKAQQLAIAAYRQSPTPEQIAAQLNWGEFGYAIAGFRPAQHHQEWINAILTMKSSQALNLIAGPNLRIAAPRGSAKTTWMIISIAAIIGLNPNIRIILSSYSEEIALSISVAIKGIIESSKYQGIFPHIQPSKRWRDGAWTVNRSLGNTTTTFNKDPTILAVGMGGSINSRRSDLIIIEDPIKRRESIANPKIREAMRDWWSGTLRPTLVPGGRVLCTCTRKRLDDIHGTTWNAQNGWQIISQKAITDNNKSYWPEYIKLEELEQMRAENPKMFACEMQNDPLDESLQIINPGYIIRGNIPNNINTLTLGIDLAISKKNDADYTALVLTGKVDKTAYVVDFIRGRWSLNETIEKISMFVFTYSKFNIIVESVAYQAAFAQEYRRTANPQMKIKEVHPKGDKETRLRGISGLFETGNIVFNQAIAFNIIIDELIKFGNCEHDDTVDALVYAIGELNLSRPTSKGGSY